MKELENLITEPENKIPKTLKPNNYFEKGKNSSP